MGAVTGPKPRELAERFYEHVNFWPSPYGCHEWTGAVRTGGYGTFNVGGRHGRMEGAHRVAWMIRYGDIPSGMFVLHRCDNRLCVNTEHLFLGSHQDNMDDMVAKGRSRKPDLNREWCRNGHELAIVGVYVPKDGVPRCRSCLNAGYRRYHAKQKERT